MTRPEEWRADRHLFAGRDPGYARAMTEQEVLNVFVVGLDDANLRELHAVPDAWRYRFHQLLDMDELQEGDIPIADLLNKAREQLDGFDGTVDAIVGYWDFPVSSIVPILCAERGLTGPPLRAVTTCEHKYWSRQEQREVAHEVVPPFALVDTEGESGPPPGLEYPIWLKPIKGFASELAFHVHDDDEFAEALAAIRDGLDRIGEPFALVLDEIDLPPEIERIARTECLAEQAMSGDQVATEGYVYRGEVHVYGVLDSVTYPDSPAFLRHQYPAQLPEQVRQRLIDVSERVIARIGLDNSTFSIEFFYHPRTDRICLLEINPRHSQSHAPLFELVDGVPNHHVMLRLALGEDPRFEQGRGGYRIAAFYNHRRFSDGIVRRVPVAEEIEAIEREVDGVRILPLPKVGQRLSEMSAQDSYSYEITAISVAADSVDELERKYQRVVELLRYDIEDCPGA